jgi:lipoprotein
MNLKKIYTFLGAAAVIMVMSTSCGDKENTSDSFWSERTFTPGYFANTIEYNQQGVWNNYENCTTGLVFDGLHITYAYDRNTGSFTGMLPSRVYDPVDRGSEFNAYPYWAGTVTAVPGNEDNEVIYGDPFMIARFNTDESLTSVPANPSLKINFTGRFYPVAMTVGNSSALYWAMKNTLHAGDVCKLVVTGVRDGVKVSSTDFNLISEGTPINMWRTFSLASLGEVDYVYMQLEGNNDAAKAAIASAPYFCMGSFQYAFGYNQ